MTNVHDLSTEDKYNLYPFCDHEYTPLKQVLMCPPSYFRISEVINETQRHFVDEKIDAGRATAQFDQLVTVLKSHGVEVLLLQPDPRFPEQVYTRDIGFTLGNLFFQASLSEEIRQKEEVVLDKWLIKQEILSFEIDNGTIEGGDVFIDGDQVLIGISDRTSLSAVYALQSEWEQFNIKPIPFTKKYLHLDCVFNILSAQDGLIYPPAFAETELKWLSKNRDLIEVTAEEQFGLATNIISIGNRVVISHPQQKRINQELRTRGYTVEEVDVSEIVKGGGAFRCITLPILR
ncbi:hypothetical protein IC620_15865 [Hazenella sp. IB182357]|uniref:Amidinotransferase n=1 Tax=Polycladospora coralii TaxID=2771432 RepID=A0A926NBF9_9BACL|nr:arginine deiminase family protein [Polycladospora coralii]MBD1373821.1 hypothetical protein [Polycladospora coralii]MBS7531976.1 hypothetical protein [Polycladospora coralii]